jgi:asparagine synthase (glutamine-hydrolysing)
LSVRCVGIADADPAVIGHVGERASARGLGVVTSTSATAVVAYDTASRPRIGVARHDDGSFVVLDGELFRNDPASPIASPDAMAAHVLARLRAVGIDGLRSLHLEAMVTWWDARTDRVVVARDHGGLVPAMIGTVGSSTVWSSDHDSLLAAGVAPRPDPVALEQHVAIGWVTPPRSFLAGIDVLPAGHAATITPGRPPAVRPWYLHTARPTSTAPFDEQVAAFGDAIVGAVHRRIGDGRIGATLSSGVDSTVVVGVLRKVLDADVTTFTFRYLGYDGQLNEDEFAAETAKLLGAPHVAIDVGPPDLDARLPELVRSFQAPVSFGVHSFHQGPIRDAGIDVVLGGSDPGFWHGPDRTSSVAAHLRRLPATARVRLLQVTERTRRLPMGEAAYWTALLADNPTKNVYASDAERRALMGDVVDASAMALATALGDATKLLASEPARLRPTFVFEQWSVPQYVGHWNHRWGRTYGFPVRAPLWDRHVIDVADRRSSWDGDKPLMRAYGATLVGHDRANAPKVYQEMPLQHWFRGPLRTFVQDALAPARVEQAGFFDARGVRAILDDHLAGQNRQWPLWQLVSAVEWLLQLRDRTGDRLLP